MTKHTRIIGGTRSFVAAAAALVVVAAAGAAAAQTTCQIPLFIKQYGADANIMFLADNSGSMNEAMWHPDYDPHTTYTGTFDPGTMYFSSTNSYKTPRSFKMSWPSTPSAYLIKSENGQDARYVGNYLNWIFYHATAAQRAWLAPPNTQVTRLQVLKPTINAVVARSASLNFGITKFYKEGPGSIEGKCSKNKTAIYAIVNGLTGDAWTPLGEAEESILNYFAETGPSCPIQAPCQKNFLVIVTDGFPTHDLDVGAYLRDADGDGQDPGDCASTGCYTNECEQCSHYMDDVAYYMAHNDLRPDMDGDQTVTTYVIGFMVDGGLLARTAANGGGLYYSANNSLALVRAFDKVMQDIIMRISSGSAVAVVSSERGDNDRMYRGKFMPGSWEGFLESYAIPYTNGDTPVWEGGNLLSDRQASDRTIFTALGTTAVNFTTDNASTLQPYLGSATADSAALVISWARGEDVAGYRMRGNWKLGDIVDSTPVIVGPPAGFTFEQDYQNYLAAHSGREKMLYIGANDGMLHCFSAASGEERWAFVPQFALPKLKTIADTLYCHTFTCDQTVTVADLKVDGTWRTVLAEGAREGGAYYFALDVTDETNPSVMWQTTLPDGYPFSSEVEFASIGGTPVALIGSGLNTVDGYSRLYAYDASDGTLLGSVQLGYVRNGRNKATKPRAVDTDLDGNADLIYVGDMSGSVWRFASGNSANPSTWSKSTLFTNGLPITAAPAAAFGEGNKILVYFGTGIYLDDTDFGTTTQQRFFCVYDRQDGATHTPTDMLDQTSTIHTMSSTTGGWYVNLWSAVGERVTEQAVVVAGAVLFTSYTPVMTICQAGGHSYMYRLKYDDGGSVKDKDGNVQPRVEDLGEGVASRPVVDLVHDDVIIQSSDAEIHVEEIGASFIDLNVKAWQESFDHVTGATYRGF